MQSLTEHQVLLGLIALAVIILLARAAGEIARRFDQPEVLGQLLAGFLLGPSVFGTLLPTAQRAILLDPGVSLFLSGLSWIGAVMLLLIAGMEVDLRILRNEAKPGLLAAGFAIVPSLIAGALFAWFVLGKAPPNGLFLGIVLSVTAVSVVSTILMERETMRRDYAQIILAAGIASEVMVWLFVSVVSAFHGSSPLLAGIRSAAFAVAFVLGMMTIGRRFVFWGMRRVRDATWIIKGQLSFVLVITFAAAALTQALGLHALLGAFIVGVLLGQAPRKNENLVSGVQSLTVGLFGPIFFVLAGTRVDISRLGSISAIVTVLLLLLVATVVKVGFSSLGAWLGGVRGWQAPLIGFGLNLKGGSDVVVAVIGTTLGLLSVRVYSMYAVASILTVLFSPVLISFLERRTPPSEGETDRLDGEEATRRAYVPRIERVMVPVEPRLLPSLAASVVERIASSKHEQGQIFDITEVEVCRNSEPQMASETEQARTRLEEASALKTVELTQRRVDQSDVLESVLVASKGYDLIAIGARPPHPGKLPSLGTLQDAIIHRAETDVLVAVNHESMHFDCTSVTRILVPTNGLEYSMAAGDIAGAIAGSCGAEVMLLHIVHSDMDERFLHQDDQDRLAANASRIMDEMAFRLGRLGLKTEQRVRVADHPGDEIMRELTRERYDIVVMGSVDRGQDDQPYLGRSVRTVLTKSNIATVVLVSKQ